MIDIEKKEIRRELVSRYLVAETSIAEEKLLAEYYASHEVDEDEKAFAQLIRIESVKPDVLSKEGVEEYDRIVGESANIGAKKVTLRIVSWLSAIAASLVLIYVLVSPSKNESQTMEIAYTIQQIMNVRIDGMVSMTATPIGDYIWVTAEMEDGTTQVFIMNSEEKSDATTLLSIL